VKLVQPVWDGLKELGLELQVIVVNNYKISWKGVQLEKFLVTSTNVQKNNTMTIDQTIVNNKWLSRIQ
jgi:hypothetical protein